VSQVLGNPGAPPRGQPGLDAPPARLTPGRRPNGSPLGRPGVSALLALLAACATVGRLAFREPEIQLQQITVTGLGLSGGTMDLVFDVWNPNDYRITSTRLEVGIDLENTHFGEALLDRPLDLSPQNHSRVVVPVRFEWAGLGAGAKGLLTHQAVGFALAGALILDTPLGDKQVGVKARGNVPLRRLIH